MRCMLRPWHTSQPLSLIDVAPTSGMVSRSDKSFWKLIVVKAAMWRLKFYTCALSVFTVT